MNTRAFSAAICSAAIGFWVVISVVPVHAATNLNSSRSNVYRPIADDLEADACVKAGGAVVVKDRKRLCEISAAAAVNLNSSKSN